MAPFWNVRYHLEDWRASENPPETRKELYNLRHARLWAVVERVFGILKRRWKIIRSSVPEYDIELQICIIYAITAIYNFMLEIERDGEEEVVRQSIRELVGERLCGKSMRKIYKEVARELWSDRERDL